MPEKKLLVNLPKWRAFVWTFVTNKQLDQMNTFSFKCCHNVLALLNSLPNNLVKLPFSMVNLLENYFFKNIYGYIYKNLDISRY